MINYKIDRFFIFWCLDMSNDYVHFRSRWLLSDLSPCESLLLLLWVMIHYIVFVHCRSIRLLTHMLSCYFTVLSILHLIWNPFRKKRILINLFSPRIIKINKRAMFLHKSCFYTKYISSRREHFSYYSFVK